MSITLKSSQLSRLAEGLAHNSPAEVAERLLREFFERIEDFKAELEHLDDLAFQDILVLSRETPTHYKWHMFSAPGKAYEIWLHEYKPHSIRSSGYAQTVHNHRYPMSALLLAGGYRCTSYSVTQVRDQRIDVRATGSRLVAAGSIYSMKANDFHSVTEIKDGTVSILIQGQAVRPYSVSVDTESRRASCHIPIEGRFDNLRSCLTRVNGGSGYAGS
jgi:hypothetical protein